MILGSMSMSPFALAGESNPDLVPAPWILETHEFNVSKSGGGGYYVNEGWKIKISHGGPNTALAVRNITQNGVSGVDYQNLIDYYVSGKQYTAGFSINDLFFDVGGQTIRSSLSTCTDFTLSYTPIVYDGTIPTFDCNITLYGIRVYSYTPYPANSSTSTFDFTLIHHIRGDWNKSTMKVEALYDLAKTRFFYPGNGTEYPAGTSFTATIQYRMDLVDNTLNTPQFIMPTGQTNTSLTYDIQLNNGSLLTLSRLDMKDTFTIRNGTSDNASVGYSFITPSGTFTLVNHVFPNLTYMDTQSIKSDPEITVYHDRIGESSQLTLLGAIVAIAAVGVIGVVVFMRKRKKGEKITKQVSPATLQPAIKPRRLKKP